MASRIHIGLVQYDLEASFASRTEDHAAALSANNNFVKCFDAELTVNEDALEDDFLKSSIYSTTPIPGTRRNSTFSFKMRMASESALDPTANFVLPRLLNSAWGASDWSRSSAASTAAAVTGNIATSTSMYEVANANSPTVGQAVILKDATASGYGKQIRWVTNVTADTETDGTARAGHSRVVLNRALSLAPAAGDTQYGGHTVYPSDTLASGRSVYFRVFREGTDEKFDLYGCRATGVKVSVEDGFPVLAFEYAVTDWRQRDDADTFPTTAWSWSAAMPYLRHDFLIDGTSVAIRPNWEFNMGIELQEIQSPQEQGRVEFEVGNRIVTGSYSPRWVKAEWQRFTNETSHELMLHGEVGLNSGNFHWAFFIPAAHLTEQPTDDAEGQLRYLNCGWRAGTYDSDNGSAAPGDTDARFFFGTSA